MKNFTQITKWLALSFGLLSPAVFAFSQQALIAQLQQPQNTQGEFIQQRFLNALNKPIQTTGKFTQAKAQGLLWQTEKPFANQLRVRATGISQWNGERWVQNTKLGQAEQIGLFLGLLSGDSEKLAQQFELHLQGSAQQWQLTLTPNTLLMRQIFDTIEIRGEKVVKQIELREKQGDRTLIEFRQVQIDQPLNAAAQAAFSAP